MKKIFRFLGMKQRAMLKVGLRTFEADKIDVWDDNINDTVRITLDDHNKKYLDIVVMSTKKWIELQVK